MAFSPIIKDWELYFDKADGYDNRATVAKAFADFWNGTEPGKLEIPGKCLLGGKVYGRVGFKDGDEIFTSYVKSVERINHGSLNGVPHDLMRATTHSGSVYYFFSDDHNPYMCLMLGDLINMGKLDPSPEYYLKREFRKAQFI